ncbi:MAG TPA: N-acetylmuramoyl-L-alanine amidase, partial [Cellvibrionaceae bacterium]
LHNHSVEQAGFVVLKSPDVPSILVETGFISNPQEAAALNSPAYRQKIAQAIYRGVHSYFAMQGPELAQPSQPTSAESRGSQSADTRAPVPAVRPDTPKIDPRAESRGRPEAVTIKPVTSAVSGKSPGAPGPVAAASTGKPQSHRVIKGDTLEKIARHYGVTQKAIIQANGMPNGVVKLGQTLIIPVP